MDSKFTLEYRVRRLERLVREGNEDLRSMLFSGKPNLIAAAVRYGYDPNDVHSVGITALMDAAMNDNLPAVRALLRNGADANIKDVDGYTALDYANKYSSDAVVKLLLDAGAK